MIQHDLRETWTSIRQDQRLLLALLRVSFVSVLLLVIGELAGPFVVNVLHLPVQDLPLIFAPAGLGLAQHLAQTAKIARRFVYRQQEPKMLEHIWQVIHPHDLVISPEYTALLKEINPDRIRYEETPDGRVVHLLKIW